MINQNDSTVSTQTRQVADRQDLWIAVYCWLDISYLENAWGARKILRLARDFLNNKQFVCQELCLLQATKIGGNLFALENAVMMS